MVYAFNPCAPEVEVEGQIDICEFKARTPKATQWDPVSRQKQTTKPSWTNKQTKKI